MKTSLISDCTHIYGYGTLEPNICSYCIEYDVDQKPDINDVYKFIPSNFANIFCFSSRDVTYPVSFLDKYKKLWKCYAEKYSLNLVWSEESECTFDTHVTYYGISSLHINQMKKAIDLLIENSFKAYIILSEEELDNKRPFMNDFLKNTSTNISIDYKSLINSQCTQGNMIITVINGFDGMTINLFAKKKDDTGNKYTQGDGSSVSRSDG